MVHCSTSLERWFKMWCCENITLFMDTNMFDRIHFHFKLFMFIHLLIINPRLFIGKFAVSIVADDIDT